MHPVTRRSALGFGLVATGSLAGCAQIPGQGQITTVELPGDASSAAPYVQPRPPLSGATPVQVVESFLQAALSREDDSAIARQHLAEPLRSEWSPQDRVVVYSAADDISLTEESEGRVRLQGRVLERIGPDGVRERLSEPEALTAIASLEQVDGEWRISQAPPGVLVSDAVFPLLFSPVRLYFLDPSLRHLVPELRWFSAQSLAAAVLAGLAQGPSGLLRDAVVSAVPATDAVAGAPLVQATDGAVRVLLPSVLESLPDDERGRAIEQIRASLTSVASISVAHVALGDQDVPEAPSPAIPRPGHRPIGAGETGVVSLDDAEAGQAPMQLVPDLQALELAAPVIAANAPRAAALSPDGAELYVASTDGSQSLRTIPLNTSVADPRVDDYGWVWAAPQNGSGVMQIYGIADGQDQSFDVSWLQGRSVLSLDIAPDATRLLVLSSREGATCLDLTSIVRDESGVPHGLTQGQTIPSGMHGVQQANWSDELRVLLLGIEDETGTAQVVNLNLLNDNRQSMLSPSKTLRVAGTALTEHTWASTSDGVLLQSRDREWDEVDVPARDPWVY